jgi:hypothetical protein
VKYQETELILGSDGEGKWDMMPEITHPVTITSRGNADIQGFLSKPKQP